MLESGQTLQLKKARYEVVTPLGSGGQGVVWKVRRQGDDALLALKTAQLSDDLSATESNIDHLRDEIAFLLGIPDPAEHYIIECLDHGAWGDPRYGEIPVFIMPYLKRSLSSLDRVPDGDTLIRWAWQLADALAWIHAHTPKGRTSIHRDLKPKNILLDDAGLPRLIDFGITKFTGATETCVARDDSFYAPEQKLPTQPGLNEESDRFSVTEKADLYNLGLTLYRLASGGGGAPSAQGALRGYDTRAIHVDRLKTNPRGLIGSIGGLTSKERGELYQALSGLFGGQGSGTMVFQGPSRLPDRGLLAEQVTHWIEQLLAPAPEDRPEAREVSAGFIELEKALKPEVNAIRLQVESREIIAEETARFEIIVSGKGLPSHGRWLEVQIDNQTLNIDPPASASSFSSPFITGEALWSANWRPTLEEQGEHQLAARVRIADREHRNEASIKVTARPEQLWRAGGNHRIAALARDPRGEWLGLIERDLSAEKYLALLTKLEQRHPRNPELPRRIANSLWGQGRREEALTRECRIDWIDQLNRDAATFGERVELLQLLERLRGVHPANEVLEQRIQTIKAEPIGQPEEPSRGPLIWAAAGMLALGLVGGGYFLLNNSPPDTDPTRTEAPMVENPLSTDGDPAQEQEEVTAQTRPEPEPEIDKAAPQPKPEEPQPEVVKIPPLVDPPPDPAPKPKPQEPLPENEPEPAQPFAQLAERVKEGDSTAIRAMLPEIRRLAEQGDGLAEFWLGYLYGEGFGVEQDLAQARRHLSRAQASGEGGAAASLKSIDHYADMLLASRDPAERRQGYHIAQAAAESGDINAMLWLAYRHDQGDGVAVDPKLAREWYARAAEAGDEVAAERLTQLAGR